MLQCIIFISKSSTYFCQCILIKYQDYKNPFNTSLDGESKKREKTNAYIKIYKPTFSHFQLKNSEMKNMNNSKTKTRSEFI